MSKRTRLLNKLKHVYSHNTKLVLDVSNDDIGLIIEALTTMIEINKRNMPIEALQEYMKFEDELVKKNFTFKSVIEAREKQIAKKVCDFNEVEEDSFYHLSFMCPNCNQAVISQPYRPNYCKHCGQKLDWSEASYRQVK